MQVTTGNKKATPCHIVCATTGLYMADATSDFQTLAITQRAERAFLFPCIEAAQHGTKFLKSLYPSFDWTAVKVDTRYIVKYNAKAA